MFLSLHKNFSFVSAAVGCGALARTSVFKSSSFRISPIAKLFTWSSLHLGEDFSTFVEG